MTLQPAATQAAAAQGGTGPVILEANHVTKTFTTPDGRALPVLDGVSFTLREGEIVALLGKSGSGKSTLLRCVAGLIAPSSGTVTYRGTPLNGANPGVAMVFQSFALLPWLTVQQNVELAMQAREVPSEVRQARALRAIDLIGLDGFESAYPKELSGGMRQRVGFARALSVEPDALLMDEPFSALDVLTAANLRGELTRLWEGHDFPVKAVLIVTHNIEEAVQLADRILVLSANPGRIRAELPVRLRRPRDRPGARRAAGDHRGGPRVRHRRHRHQQEAVRRADLRARPAHQGDPAGAARHRRREPARGLLPGPAAPRLLRRRGPPPARHRHRLGAVRRAVRVRRGKRPAGPRLRRRYSGRVTGAWVRPRVGVSSCLLGEEVRFNGGHKRYRFLTDELAPYVDWMPFCPEVAIGLGTPREPIRLTAGGRLVNRSGTADHTASMAALPLPSEELDGYVFKAKSPSCGIRAIPRYDPDGSPAGSAGPGLYAGRVLARFPLLAVEDEGRLNDRGLREAFVERIFAAARLRVLFSGSWSSRDLVAFHARHKLQLLAHDPARYRAAGRVVAAAGPGAAVAYRDLFLAAMASPATRGRNANALQHAYSRVGRELGRPRRADLVARIEAYRRGEEPLSVPVALLAHYASGGGFPWLAEQTYLRPFPPGLRLRHSA